LICFTNFTEIDVVSKVCLPLAGRNIEQNYLESNHGWNEDFVGWAGKLLEMFEEPQIYTSLIAIHLSIHSMIFVSTLVLFHSLPVEYLLQRVQYGGAITYYTLIYITSNGITMVTIVMSDIAFLFSRVIKLLVSIIMEWQIPCL
jgi:hypothetical protein